MALSCPALSCQRSIVGVQLSGTQLSVHPENDSHINLHSPQNDKCEDAEGDFYSCNKKNEMTTQ
uniref:Uncharacterized protein n=1 Tax=Romanomermis culicivorax TaxID=13658 RepID=A0A915JV76_ROMCU